MARFRLRRGRALEAVRAAERARTAAPNDIEARMTLVTALSQAGQHASAIEQSEAAIRDWPKRSELYLELGRLQLAVGNRDEALHALSTALQLDPTSIPVLTTITAAEMREGKGQAALLRIEQRLRARPDDSDLQLLSGRAYAVAGEDAKAEAALRRVVQQQPASPVGLMSLGRFYVERGRLGDAREIFERLDRIDGRTGSSTVLGAILEEQDRPADAELAFERALTANPRDGVAANNLAWLYQQQGRLDEALRWAIVANEQLRRGETRDTLGWIRVQRGEYREALPALMAAIEAKPDDPLYRYHIAVAYSQTGSIAQARDELRRALATDSQFPGRDDAKKLAAELDAAHAANPTFPRSHPR
jgi:tetratricopeptide (TPR) repeat protein